MRNYDIESDLKQEKLQNIKLVQGDRGNKVKINVYEDGQPVSLTGCSITAKYKRADGQVVDGTVENITDNYFYAVMDSDITKVAGTLKMLFTIEKSDVQVSTFLLLADVREGIGGGEVTVDLSNYYKKSETYSKSQIDSQFKDIANRLEILPIKNTHHIIQDGVPVSQHTITLNEIECEAYLFNDEQITVPDNLVLENFENKFSAICFNSKGLVNAIVTYNDGKNDITKEVKLVCNDFNNSASFSYRENGDTGSLIIEFGFDYDTGKFYVYVGELKADGDSVTFYEVKKVSLSYSYITNLLDDDYLKSIDYSKIKNVPYQLNALLDGSIKTLDTGEYASLFDNLFIWDANKINDRLDDTSGVKQNGYYNHNIKIKQKDSEGIGYGQYIPSSTMSGYKLFVSAGQDVIVKVYNRTRKTLLTKLSDFTYGKYKEITIHDSYSGTDGIFIAFTVKDSVTNFYGNTYVDDLILCKPSTFLTKQDVNNKVDKSQLSFNSDGELVVTIDGISKTFVPKA